MNAPLSLAQSMALAAALTREGRLADATRTIQEALSGHPTSTPGSNDEANDRANTLGGVVLDGLVTEVDERPAPGRARFDTHTCTTAHGQRDYKLYLPASLADTTHAPLVVMLHGCKQNPDDFAAGTRMNALAEAQGLRVLYPSQAPRSNMSRCWNWFNTGDQSRGQGEPALLAAMVAQVSAEHAVDPDRVYIAGLSAGGAMAAIMATEYPDLFAAAGVHSGLPPGAASDMASAFAAMKRGPAGATSRSATVPLIVFHGDRDDIVNPCNGERLVPPHTRADQTRGQAGGGREYVCTVHHDNRGRAIAEHWLVHGMGHAWSGGDTAGSYTDPTGPDASREMLRFFAQHRRG